MATGIDGRQALIEAAIDAIAVRGVARTHPKDLTESLGLSKSLVNFHFDGRDGLLAEAIATALERQVEGLEGAVRTADADPIERLLLWVDALLSWSAAHPGLTAATAFPESTPAPGTGHDGTSTRITEAIVARRLQLRGLVLAARDTTAGGEVGGADDRTGGDEGPEEVLWWLLQGAAVSVADRPDHLEGIGKALRRRIPELLTT